MIRTRPTKDDMPHSVTDPTIAVLDEAPDVYNTPQDKLNFVEYDHEINTVDALDAIRDCERKILDEYVERLIDADVDVVLNRAGIHRRVAGALANEDILVLEPLMKNADDIVHTTGAPRVTSISDFEPETLGSAEHVGVEKFGNDYVISIEGGTDGEMATLYVHGSSEYAVEKIERAINEALEIVAEAGTAGVVLSAGSTELAIASELRDHAVDTQNNKQLAIESFAESIEVLPRALAVNAGLEPLDTMVELRATFEAEGRGGIIDDDASATVGDPPEAEVFEPAAVKRKTIESANEAATMIIRIDDVTTAD